MKSDLEIMQSVRAAIDDCTRGIEDAHSLRYQIARKAKGEEPVRKRISTSMIFVIVLLIISITTALAAGLGLFGELADSPNADNRLPALEETAETLDASFAAEEGVTVEIGQAYYEGNRVFIAYKMSGNLTQTTLYEGAPEEGYQWNDVLENFVAAQQWTSDFPEIQRALSWLDGKAQRWAVTSVAFLHDGLYLEDGTYLDIIGGDEVVQADGSLLGWKECEIPLDKLADTLTFKAILGGSRQVMFQDKSTYMRQIERGESTEIPFTLQRNERHVFLKGEAATEVYQAQAALVLGGVDLKGTISLSAPTEWVNSWTAPATADMLDTIIAWNLYRNGDVISKTGTQCISLAGTQEILFELLYPRLSDLKGLTLIPEYAQTGEHPDEAISIHPIIE